MKSFLILFFTNELYNYLYYNSMFIFAKFVKVIVYQYNLANIQHIMNVEVLEEHDCAHQCTAYFKI